MKKLVGTVVALVFVFGSSIALAHENPGDVLLPKKSYQSKMVDENDLAGQDDKVQQRYDRKVERQQKKAERLAKREERLRKRRRKMDARDRTPASAAYIKGGDARIKQLR